MITENFRRWANQPDRKRRTGILINLPRSSDGEILPLRVADSGGEIDGLGNWRACIASPAKVKQSMQELMTGNSLTTYGQIKLALDSRDRMGLDGKLSWDDLQTLYRWPGAAARQFIGGDDLAWADWATYFKGSVGFPQFEDTIITADVFAPSRSLETTTVPANKYGGSVPDSSKDKTMPLCLGGCPNLTPILISDGGGSGPWVYQWMDPAIGSSYALDAVYVDSVQVTSGFTVNLTQNTVTFSSKPSATPTLDVRGWVYGGVFVTKFGELAKALLKFYRGCTDADLDLSTFTALDAAFPYPLNKYLTSQTNLKALLDDLAGGLPVFWDDQGEGGTYRVGLFSAPAGEPDLKVYDGVKGQNPTYGSAWGWQFKRKQAQTWYSQITLKGNRNYTTQTPSNSSLTSDRLGWLKEEYRTVTVTTSAPADNDFVEIAEWTTNLSSASDLLAVANMQAVLHGVERWLVEFESLAAAMVLKAAAQVQVFRGCWGWQNGWTGKVIDLDFSSPVMGRVTLWG